MASQRLAIELKRICASLSGYAPEKRQAVLLSRLSEIPDEHERDLLLQLATTAIEVTEAAAKSEIVLLIHGIRTHGDWQEMVRQEIEELPHRVVIPLRYDYLDVFRFWFPFFTRRAAISKIYRRVQSARAKYREADISVVAHSFGTYAIAKILLANADVRLRRLVLCGAIIPTEFEWPTISHRIEADVINDCGGRDIWPVLAQALSWGYGASGTFGFGTPGVQDRFHNYKHSDYFSRPFVKEYWKSFFADSRIARPDWETDRTSTPWWVSMVSILPLRYAVLAVIVVAVIGGFRLAVSASGGIHNLWPSKFVQTVASRSHDPELDQILVEVKRLQRMVPVPSTPDEIKREAERRREEPQEFRPSSIFWPIGATIRVAFLDGTKSEQDSVFNVALEWARYANVNFARAPAETSDVRVSFEGAGDWSYMGTQCLGIRPPKPTTILGAMSGRVDQQQSRMTILHVFGHVLGLIHEHQTPAAIGLIDLQKAYEYFRGAPMYWTQEMVDRNLGTLKDVDPLYATKPFDPSSVMLYHLPPEATASGQSTEPMGRLSPGDIALIRRVYPGR